MRAILRLDEEKPTGAQSTRQDERLFASRAKDGMSFLTRRVANFPIAAGTAAKNHRDFSS
jgi:hypothetical protein